MMRFIVVALWLLSRTVAPAVTHPEAAAELLGAERPYALCLDVVLNRVDVWVQIPPGALNSTAAGQLLLQSAARKDPRLAHDPSALKSISAWVEARATLKVLVRLDTRQALRRSRHGPPRLLLTSGSCVRSGASDVLAVRRRRSVTAPAAASSLASAHGSSRGYACAGDEACEGRPSRDSGNAGMEEEVVVEDTWVLADFSSVNAASPADWKWLLGNGAASLQSLAVPLPTLMDLVEETNGDSRTENGDADNGAAPGGDNQELLPLPLPLAVAAVVRAAMSGRYLLPGADVAFALPYCGPSTTSESTLPYMAITPENARALSDAVLDVFNRLTETPGKFKASNKGSSGGSTASSRSRSPSISQWAPGAAVMHFATYENGTTEHITDRRGALCSSTASSNGISSHSREHAYDCSASLTPSLAALAAFNKDAIGPTDIRRAAEATAKANNAGSTATTGDTHGGMSTVHLWSAVVATTSTSEIAPRASGSGAAPEIPNHGEGHAKSHGAVAVSGTFVINLARRPDRWQQMLRRAERAYGSMEDAVSTRAAAATGLSPLQLERLEAIDGAVLLSRTSDSDPISLTSASTRSSGSSGSSSGSSSSSGEEREKVEEGEEELGFEDEDSASDNWWLSRAAVAEQFHLGPSSSSLQSNPSLKKASSPFWNGNDDDEAGNEALEKERALPPPVIMNPYEDHGWRASVIGCALSHMKAWRQIAARGWANPYASFLVLEDDAELSGDFADRFQETMRLANQHYGWDLIFLGVLDDRGFYGDSPAAWSCTAAAVPSTCREDKAPHETHPSKLGDEEGNSEEQSPHSNPEEMQDEATLPPKTRAATVVEVGVPSDGLFKLQQPKPRHQQQQQQQKGSHSRWPPLRCLLRDVSTAGRTFGSGLFAYVLRPKGAMALLAAAAAHPITQPIDWWVWERLAELPGQSPRSLNRLQALKAWPPLASSPEGEGRDSDNDEAYHSLRFLASQALLTENGGDGTTGDRSNITKGSASSIASAAHAAALRIVYPPEGADRMAGDDGISDPFFRLASSRDPLHENATTAQIGSDIAEEKKNEGLPVAVELEVSDVVSPALFLELHKHDLLVCAASRALSFDYSKSNSNSSSSGSSSSAERFKSNNDNGSRQNSHPTNNGSGVGEFVQYEPHGVSCRSLGAAARVLLLKEPGKFPGTYGAMALLVSPLGNHPGRSGRDGESMGASSQITAQEGTGLSNNDNDDDDEDFGAAEAVRSVVGSSAQIVARSKEVQFRISAFPWEESVAVAVEADGNLEVIRWRPHCQPRHHLQQEGAAVASTAATADGTSPEEGPSSSVPCGVSIYEVAHRFCVERLNLHAVDAAAECVEKVEATLRARRRKGQGKDLL